MKKLTSNTGFALLAIAALISSCKKESSTKGTTSPAPSVKSIVSSSAGDSAGVVTKINEFRLLAGDPLNSAPGASVGRREVNWDAVPGTFTNANNFPFDFFGSSDPALPNGRKRGLILQNTGTSFRVDSTSFADVDASYASQFQTFSKTRVFAYMGNNITEVSFKIPGTNTNASVHGFGVVFSDVDDANSTTIEYFSGNKSLGLFKVPGKTATGNFSFLGVGFPEEKITRVKITCGNGTLGAGVKDISNGGTKDLVVMDDFIYDEPKAQ